MPASINNNKSQPHSAIPISSKRNNRQQHIGKSGSRTVSAQASAKKKPATQHLKLPQQTINKKLISKTAFDQEAAFKKLNNTKTIGKAMKVFHELWKQQSLSKDDRLATLTQWKQHIRHLAFPHLFDTLAVKKTIKGKQAIAIDTQDLAKYHQNLSLLLSKKGIGKKGKSDNMPIDLLKDNSRLKKMGLNLKSNGQVENLKNSKTAINSSDLQ